MKNAFNGRNIRMGMLDIHVNVGIGIESVTWRRGMLDIHANVGISIESVPWRRRRRHKVRRNGTWVVKRWLWQGWNRWWTCNCIGYMVLCFYVSGASAFGFEVSGTVGACKGWRRRTKVIDMISIWHHCKSISQAVRPARRARDLRRMARKRETALASG